MRRKEDKSIEKVTLNLFKGDFRQIQEWEPRLGAAKIVRELVNAYVARERMKREAAAQEVLQKL